MVKACLLTVPHCTVVRYCMFLRWLCWHQICGRSVTILILFPFFIRIHQLHLLTNIDKAKVRLKSFFIITFYPLFYNSILAFHCSIHDFYNLILAFYNSILAFSIRYSLFITRYSRFITRYLTFITRYSLFIHNSILDFYNSILNFYNSKLTFLNSKLDTVKKRIPLQ